MNAPAVLAELSTGLLTYAAHSAAACVLALLAARLLSRPQQRDLLWKTALVAPVFTSALSIAGTAWLRIDLAHLARRIGIVGLPGRRMMVRVVDIGNGPVVSRQLQDPVTNTLSIAVCVLVTICITVAMARFVHRRRVLARALSGRSHVRDLITGRSRTVHLCSADALHSPIALTGSEVCLPTLVMNEFSEEHRDTLIAHELAHLERKDPAWFFCVELITALSAFQPLVFIVGRNFRRDVELICDEAAVHSTGNRHALIGALAQLASPFDARSPILGAATAWDGSPLVMRATRIASLTVHETPMGAGRMPLLAAAVLFGILCAVPVVSSAPSMSEFPSDLIDGAARARREGRVVEMDSVVGVHQRRVKVLIR